MFGGVFNLGAFVFRTTWPLKHGLGAFTLAGISGIQISVFASRSKSWDFYKCGHKKFTNYRDQHRAANRNTSCDCLGISAIICIAADVLNARANDLGIFYPIIPSERIKTARRSARYFRLSEQAQNISVFQIAMEISIFLVYECD